MRSRHFLLVGERMPRASLRGPGHANPRKAVGAARCAPRAAGPALEAASAAVAGWTTVESELTARLRRTRRRAAHRGNTAATARGAGQASPAVKRAPAPIACGPAADALGRACERHARAAVEPSVRGRGGRAAHARPAAAPAGVGDRAWPASERSPAPVAGRSAVEPKVRACLRDAARVSTAPAELPSPAAGLGRLARPAVESAATTVAGRPAVVAEERASERTTGDGAVLTGTCAITDARSVGRRRVGAALRAVASGVQVADVAGLVAESATGSREERRECV